MQLSQFLLQRILFTAQVSLYCILLTCTLQSDCFGQSDVQLKLYNNSNQQNLYDNSSIIHTAWKPIVYADTLLKFFKDETWVKRKFLHEHLLQIQTPGFNFYGDFIVDEYIGRSNRYKKKNGTKLIDVTMPGMDTRGFEIRGNIGKKVYFESNFYESQGKFSGYIDSSIRYFNGKANSRYGVIPGLGGFKNLGNGSGFDFSSSSTRLIYMPFRHFLLNLGYGKNFIGDGYRSLLLSENSFNYPYFRASFTYKKLQYSVMWSQYTMSDRSLSDRQGYFRSWGQTYFVDWAPTPNFSVGLFEAVLWPDQTHAAYRQKDVTPWLVSPIIFLHGSKSPAGTFNNDITGLNTKLHFSKHSYLYGQMVVNQLGKLSSINNRTGFQLGARLGDLFSVHGLDTHIEWNSVRPYTYQGTVTDVNYANYNQALAHPLGANFTEYLATVTYSISHWRFRAEGFVAKYGADTGISNYGHNVVFQVLPTHTYPTEVRTGQGIATTLTYADFKAAYILNSLTNLRVEAGFTYRYESGPKFNYNDKIIYIGIRMSFREILYDF